VVQPELAALSEKLDRALEALTTLLAFLENKDPLLLQAYLTASKGN
jgi:hypothetical protein